MNLHLARLLAVGAWVLRGTALVALVLPRWPVDLVLVGACGVGLWALLVVSVAMRGAARPRGGDDDEAQ